MIARSRQVMAGLVAVLLLGLLMACGTRVPSSDSTQADQTEAQRQEAVNEVGMPAITNFAEMRMARDMYELRDNPQATYAYLQAMDGGLRCLGEAFGYGLPYAAQFSNPDKIAYASSYGVVTLPQSEPNGLFMPDSAAATWIMLKGPDGTLHPVYVEPNVVISPFPLPCKPLDQ